MTPASLVPPSPYERALTVLRGVRRRTRARVWRTALGSLGKDCQICDNVRFFAARHIFIGDEVWLNDDTILQAHPEAPIRIGSRVGISYGVMILTGELTLHERTTLFAHRHQPISIHDGAWIAARAVVLAGVTIGENAVVAAGAVVTRDVASDTVVGGVPARVLSGAPK